MKRFILTLLLIILVGSLTAVSADSAPITLSAPQGAPALTVAVLASEISETEASFDFVAANLITAKFEEAASDFIIAPLNAGAVIYKKGNRNYRLAAVVTWGNLVFASRRAGFTPQDINGNPVTLFGEKTMNASIALYSLEENGIIPSEVNYLASAAETQQLLLSDPDAIVMTAEPMVTVAKIKNEEVEFFLLNDLYQNATGDVGFAQAGLFVRVTSMEEKPEEIRSFMSRIQSSAEACTVDVEKAAEAAVALEILPNMKIALTAIPNCGIRYVSASEAREQIEKTAQIDLTQFGGELPADEFYVDAE